MNRKLDSPADCKGFQLVTSATVYRIQALGKVSRGSYKERKQDALSAFLAGICLICIL